MSFNSQYKGLQRYLIETDVKKQGDALKYQLKEVQFLVQKLQKKYSPSDSQMLREKTQGLKMSMRELEKIEPKSRHELIEKKTLLEAYGKELGKIENNIHSLQGVIESPQEVDEKIQVVAYEEEMHLEKVRELKAIEGDVIEINHMLKDCAESIQEQGVELNSAEYFVEISSETTKSAVNELEKANGYQKSSNTCCIKIIAVCAVFLVLGLLIIYYT